MDRSWTCGRAGSTAAARSRRSSRSPAAEYLKGNLGEHVTVRVPGGQIGRYRTVFVGAPEFREGDEVVLFLKQAGRSDPYIIGLSQGAFRVVPDARTGRRW